jgi:hypothetical protein
MPTHSLTTSVEDKGGSSSTDLQLDDAGGGSGRQQQLRAAWAPGSKAMAAWAPGQHV